MIKYILIFFLMYKADATCLSSVSSALKDFYGKKVVLAENNHIQIIGPTKINKIAKGILQRTERFDKNMQALGFKIPEQTQIHINKDSVLGGFISPYFSQVVADRWKGTIYSKIQINHYNVPNNQIIQSKSVLFHERTHSVLFNTYKNDSFIIADGPVQEGLADYFSSSFTKNPKVGYNHRRNGAALRDLETKAFSKSNGKVEVMDDIANTTEKIHEYSLHYSNVLWKMEQKIGSVRMNSIIKNLLDDLNSFHASYQEVLTTIALPNRINYNKQNFHYFLAAIEETLKKYPETKSELDSTIAAIKLENGVNISDYQKIQAGLIRSETDFVNYNEPLSRFTTIVLPALGGTTLAGGSTTLAIFINKDIKRQRKKQ